MQQSILIDDKTIKHLEIGAGCGNFGKIFFPQCYLTDKDDNLKENCDVCYIDYFCDACELPWSDNRFSKIIICNPYGYGFRDDESTEKLMNEVIRVLSNDSELLLLCNNINTYCNPKRVKTRLTTYTQDRLNIKLSISEQTINSKQLYPNYIFRTLLGVETSPKHKITIHVSK